MSFGLVTQATVVTQDRSFNLQTLSQKTTATNDGNGATVTTNAAAGNTSEVLNFNLFDPTLGTLNSVTFVFTSTVTGEASVSLVPTAGGDLAEGTYFASGTLSRSLSGVSGLGVLQSNRNFKAECLAPDGLVGCLGTDIESDTFDHGPAALTAANFLGPGSFNVTATLEWTALAIGPDNSTQYADNGTLVGQLAGDWDGDLTLRYDYTPNAPDTGVPEPASLYLAGAALALAAALRRRRG